MRVGAVSCKVRLGLIELPRRGDISNQEPKEVTVEVTAQNVHKVRTDKVQFSILHKASMPVTEKETHCKFYFIRIHFVFNFARVKVTSYGYLFGPCFPVCLSIQVAKIKIDIRKNILLNCKVL